jgi:sulfofructose kinase
MSEAFDVICCGNSAFDHIWYVDELPAGDGKFRGHEYVERIGGLAANAAIAVSRLGGRVTLWSRAGEDETGRKMLDQLAARGVDATHFRLITGARSPHSAVIVDRHGARTIVSFRGGGWSETPNWLPLEQVRGARAVHSDTRWRNAAVAMFTVAREAGVPSVLDIERSERPVLERLLPLTDYAIFSLPGFRDFAQTDDLALGLQRAADAGATVPAVTLGGDGVAWLEAGQVRCIGGYKVAAIDTTGAGDVFHGAFALVIGQGMAIEAAMRFASAAAALKCTRVGGGAGTPARVEVEEFLAAQGAAAR